MNLGVFSAGPLFSVLFDRYKIDTTIYYRSLLRTTIRVVALALALWPCLDATIHWARVGRALVGSLGPCGPPWALLDRALVGRGLWASWAVVNRALVGPPGPLWAGLLWAQRALVSPSGPLWAGPPPRSRRTGPGCPPRSDTANGTTDDVIATGYGSGPASCTMTPEPLP